jgi:3-hydroxyisobutyrate dehydrogenase
MAQRIIDAGYPTTLWSRHTAAKVAGSPAELAAASDLVCVCVVGDADVVDITTREDGVLAGLAEGGVVAIHSTVHPSTCHDLAERAGAQGVSVIDAPVSGGGTAAAEGCLLAMVGAVLDAAESALTLLSHPR